MTSIRKPGIVLVIVALVACLWAIGNSVARSDQDSQGQDRWEYAQLVLAEGNPVFIEAESRSTVNPPTDTRSGAQSGEGRTSGRYTVVSRARSDHVAALNLFASQGWQAVAITPMDSGFMVLMRRRR